MGTLKRCNDLSQLFNFGEMKKKKPKTAKEKPKPPTTPPDETSDDRFNFGGLPQRDLKKNLGCG